MPIDRSGAVPRGNRDKLQLTVEGLREDVGNPKAERFVLTIESAQLIRARPQDSWDTFMEIVFQEYPEHAMRTNKGQNAAFFALVDAGHLPDDESQDGALPWQNIRIPLKVVKTEWKEHGKVKSVHYKLYPVPAAEYEKALSDYDRAVEAAEKAQSKATRRR